MFGFKDLGFGGFRVSEGQSVSITLEGSFPTLGSSI